MGSTPLTLRCSKCRKYREWDSSRSNYDKLSDRNLVATGRSKKARRGTSGRRGNPCGIAVEMRHDGPSPHTGKHCGHVFWSTHPQAVEKWKQVSFGKTLRQLIAERPQPDTEGDA